MRISDWSSDVCSSDLARDALVERRDLAAAAQPLHHAVVVQAVGDGGLPVGQVEALEGLEHDVRGLGVEIDVELRRRGDVAAAGHRAAHHHQPRDAPGQRGVERSEEHTSELQSLMRISYAVFCLKNKKNKTKT